MNILAEAYLLTANFYQTVVGYDYSAVIFYTKVFSFFASVILAIALFMIIFKLRGLLLYGLGEIKEEMMPREEFTNEAQKKWAEIKDRVNSFNEAEWKLSVIEADKFVDEALKNAGFEGESMGERLMMIEPGQILSLQSLWDAHKLRNLLVHDNNYQVSHRQAILVIEAFEGVLKELAVIS